MVENDVELGSLDFELMLFFPRLISIPEAEPEW